MEQFIQKHALVRFIKFSHEPGALMHQAGRPTPYGDYSVVVSPVQNTMPQLVQQNCLDVKHASRISKVLIDDNSPASQQVELAPSGLVFIKGAVLNWHQASQAAEAGDPTSLSCLNKVVHFGSEGTMSSIPGPTEVTAPSEQEGHEKREDEAATFQHCRTPRRFCSQPSAHHRDQ